MSPPAWRRGTRALSFEKEGCRAEHGAPGILGCPHHPQTPECIPWERRAGGSHRTKSLERRLGRDERRKRGGLEGGGGSAHARTRGQGGLGPREGVTHNLL